MKKVLGSLAYILLTLAVLLITNLTNINGDSSIIGDDHQFHSFEYDCCYEDLFAATGEIRKRYRVIDDCGADFICTMHCVPVEAPRPIEVPVSVIGAAGGTMDVLLNAEILNHLHVNRSEIQNTTLQLFLQPDQNEECKPPSDSRIISSIVPSSSSSQPTTNAATSTAILNSVRRSQSVTTVNTTIPTTSSTTTTTTPKTTTTTMTPTTTTPTTTTTTTQTTPTTTTPPCVSAAIEYMLAMSKSAAQTTTTSQSSSQEASSTAPTPVPMPCPCVPANTTPDPSLAAVPNQSHELKIRTSSVYEALVDQSSSGDTTTPSGGVF